MAPIDRADIRIKPATPDFAEFVPELVYDTDPHLWACIFGGLTDEFRALTQAWFKSETSFLSHKFTRVAMAGSEPLGMTTFYDAPTQKAALDATAEMTAGLLSMERLTEILPNFALAGYIVPVVPDGEIYVLILSLLPTARGRGVGALLLDSVYDTAREEGRRSVSLDVYATNPAVRFYERMGMETMVETNIPAFNEAGVGLHYRMVKTL